MYSNILSIIEQLKSDNSRLFKEQVLKDNVDNQLLKSVLIRALGSHIQYYQRKIPQYTPNFDGSLELIEALEKLNDLADRKVTGNAAIAYLSDILSNVHEDDAKVIELIIKKDLDCGVQTSTVNKVWKGLIPEFETMLCSPVTDKLIEQMKFPAIVQLKMDGGRVNVVVNNGIVTFFTRNGKTFDIQGQLEQEFLAAANGKNLVFDGELLIDNNGLDESRKVGNGIFNRLIKNTADKEDCDRVVITLWDVIQYDKWVDEKDPTSYSDRFALLNSLSFDKRIRIVESTTVNSFEEAQIICDDYISKGFEGVIIKDPSSIWEPKRSKQQVNLKAEEEATLRIIGIQEHNKRSGQVGSLLCETEDGKLQVSVGSGLNDLDRVNITEADIGKIVVVKYNEVITSKGKDKASLFLPRFPKLNAKDPLEFRLDVDVADTLSHLK